NVSVSEKAISIYQINYLKGNESATGTMASMLKVENQKLTLPEVDYQYEGHSFKNWRGSTGTYEDKGVMVANPENTFVEDLTAVWSLNAHTYTVNYYLMGLDGNYPETATSSKEFFASYGSTVHSNDAAIQLDQMGFTLDTTEGKIEEKLITTDGGALNVYYQRNKYNLTTSYTLPDSSEATTVTNEYYYDSDITGVLSDANKPSVDSFVFVGWSFGDNGKKPDKMPANDVVATGYFVPEQVTYNIRYYLQDLDEAGDTVGESYSLDDAYNRSLKATYGDTLTFSDYVEVPDGFKFAGVHVTHGEETAPTTGTIEFVEGDTTTAGVNDTLNIYFTREKYTATLNVWKGKVNGDLQYTSNIELYYGANIPTNLPTLNNEDWGLNDDPEYKLADYVGWSTGEAPTTMPAGDITVTRQYVKKVTGYYQVEVYLETETDDVYESPRIFTFYDNVGTGVSVGTEETDTIKLASFANGINYWEYYKYATVTEGDKPTKLSGNVTDTNEGEDPLVLRVYMNRKVVTSTISYYADNVKIAEVKKDAKWGHKYHYDALSLFDSNEGGLWTQSDTTDGFRMLTTVDGSNPDVYDFRNNNYVVTYGGQYIMNDVYKWPQRNYDSVDSLAINDEIIMGQTSNTCTVRYSKVNPLEMYRILLTYNSSNLSHGVNQVVNLTYTANETTYNKIYIANEAYFFNNVTYTAEGYENYPGLAYYNKGLENSENCKLVYSTEDSNLKDGYSKVTIGGKTYYTSVEGDSNVLYIPEPNNTYFVGKWTSANASGKPGYKDAVDYLAQYKETWSEDQYAQGAYIYSSGWGSTVKYDASDARLTITYRNGNVYQISYNLGGAICSDESHRFAASTVIDTTNPSQFGCEHPLMVQRAGYDIVWYEDGGFTTKPSGTFKLNNNKTFYGRYEKSILYNTAYEYYELANYLDGVKYITKDNVETLMAQYSERLRSDTNTDQSTITDEFGNSVTVAITTTTYTLDGVAVMKKTQVPSLSFADVTYTNSDQTGNGLKYDSSNPINIVKGYVQSDPIEFVTYYSRDKVELIVDKKIPKGNEEQSLHRKGETITLADPTRDGYTFAGWEWYYKDNDAYTKYSSFTSSHDEEAQTTTFTMPAQDIKVVATWTASNYDQTIYHYFQNVNTRTYDKETIATLINAAGSTTTVSFNNATYDATLYSNGFVSIVMGNETYYFTKAVDGTVAIEDLSAIVEKPSTLQDETVTVRDGLKSVDHYNYVYTLRQYEETIEQLASSNTYVNQYGMIVEHFYSLEEFTITTAYKSIGATGNVALIGDGTYMYGSTATLKASYSAGFSFVGWYKTSDLPATLTEASLEDVTKVSETASFSAKVTADESYTAVILAEDVDTPDLEIVGCDSFEYNDSTTHAVKIKATFKEDASDASYIKGYQWYEGTTPITGATSSSFTIPVDWDAGEHVLKCVVTVARKDNGVEKEVISDTTTVTITAVSLEEYFKAKNHSAKYDGTDNHSISVVCTPKNGVPAASDYDIYYSETELTSDNYQSGSTNNLKYTNVKTVEVDGVVTRSYYTVYYYVAPKSTNYSGFGGYATVEIKPVSLTLSAGSASYSKVYDGNAKVLGDLKTAGTDLYNLVRGTNIYTINGLIDGDKTNTYIIDCDASFNSRHVSDASAVTLSNIVLANDAGDIQYNYIFADSYSINLTGYIDPKSIELSWDKDSFEYDGDEHCPTATLPTTICEIDKDNLSVSVTGGQTNVGSAWNAVAKMVSSDEATQTGDYSLSNQTKTYAITKKSITFTFDGAEVTYDGDSHTLANSSIKTGDLIDGYSYTCDSDTSEKNVGEYDITPTNIKISDANGADMTGNYQITAEPGKLTINKQSVTVGGIVVENKDYDGTTDATVNLDNIMFTGLIEGDQLALDASKVSAVFDDKNAGEGKSATITISAGALTGSDVGNYELNIVGSQKTTTADINKLTITVTPDNKETIYGEQVNFTAAYSGFISGEDESVISGSASYSLGSDKETYEGKHDAGTHTINVDTAGLSADNYNFVGSTGTLTINARPVKIEALTTTPIEKVYDGKTTVRALVKDTDYQITGNGTSASGVANGDNLTITYSASYASKNASDNNPITVTSLALKNNTNYYIDNSSFTLPGKITQKALTIKAENKTITYGESSPEFTVEYEGFVTGDNATKLTGTLSFNCAYDTSVEANRVVGDYDIVPDGLSSQDYAITFEKGTLTVNKKMLTVATAISQDTHKVNYTYGSDSIPTFEYSISGFAYEDDESVVRFQNGITEASYNLDNLTETDNHIDSIPRSYTVTVNNEFEATNYDFTVKSVNVNVVKAYLTIQNIKVNSREYDGTTKVNQSQFNFGNLEVQGLFSGDEGFWDQNKENPLGADKLFTITNATYNSKDVTTANTASFTINFGTYLSERYAVNNNQSSAQASITKRPLTITAKSDEVKYGNEAPAFDATFDGLVTGEVANKNNVDLTSAYTLTTQVGTLVPIVVSGLKTTDATKFNHENYAPTYVNGTLTVVQYHLDSPTPVWDQNDAGTIKWNEIQGISNVDVAGYEVRLMKDGQYLTDTDATVTVNNTTFSYDFLEVMRSNGAGCYNVAVKALASEVNNAEYINVGHSVVDENSSTTRRGLSGYWFASKVYFKPASDQHSQNGIAKTTIESTETYNKTDSTTNSYIVICGESGVDLSAVLINRTGYTIKSVKSANSNITINANNSDYDANRNGDTYSSTFDLSNAYRKSDDITIEIELEPRPATLSVVVEPIDKTKQELVYGYSADSVPVLKATTSHNDVVENADDAVTYTYTYEWSIYASLRTEAKGDNTDTLTFEPNLRVNKYLIGCKVIAVRNDNGESATVNVNYNTYRSNPINSRTVNDNIYMIEVVRANFIAKARIAGWTYGAVPNNPEVYDTNVDANAHPALADPTFYYRENKEDMSESDWTDVKPSDAGDYQVRASIAASTNYNDFTTAPSDFTIAKAKLATPTDLGMAPSDNAPYGKISWEAVTGPKANGNGAQIGVTYVVELYKDDNLYKTYDDLTKTYIDITEDLQGQGVYYFKVQAKSSNDANCEHSDWATSENIQIAAPIVIKDHDEVKANPSYEKKYDASPISLTVNETGSNYQWYKGKTVIEKANAATNTPTHVADTGIYSCVAIVDGKTVYTPMVYITITKRSLKIRSNDAEKVYDGTPLTNNSVTDTFEGFDGFAQGEGATYTWSGTATNVADTRTGNNTFTWSFDDKTNANDYETSDVGQGTLTITPRTITDDNTVFTVAGIDAKTYDATEYKPTPTITDKGLATNTDTELGNDDFEYSYTNNINATTDTSKAVVTITGKGNYDGSTTREYVINKRSITFTGENKEVTYKGSEQKTTDVTITGGGLVSGHTHDLTFEAKATEARDTAYPGTITSASDVHIKDAQENDVTSNYAIQVVNGSIKINKTTEALVITFADDSHVYNTQPQHHEHPATANQKTGTTTFQYKFDDTGYTSDLSTLEKTDVGEYDITVEAKNPNYANAATATAKLKITKKPITVNVVGNNVTATYDGTEHSQTEFVATTEDANYNVANVALKAGVTASAERTDAGTTKMGLTEDSFVNNDPNYKVNFVVTDGYVTINPRTINDTNFDVASITPYVYGDAAYTPTPTVTDKGLATNTATDLVVGKDFTYSYSNNINATTESSKAKVTITGKGNYTGSIERTFEINKRPIKFTGDSTTVTYTGSEQSIETYTVNTDAATNKGLVTGHTHNFTYKAKGTEASTTPYAGELTAAANVKIYKDANKTNEVTENYDITVENGTITINQSDVEWEISLENDSYQYDGNDHYNTKTAVSHAATGTTTFQYSLDNADFKDNLNELTRKDFGTYPIYVKATNPNYKKTATTTSELSITAKPIEVQITGNHIENVYDGTAHVINDYVPSTTETLYDTNHVVFTGTASATQKAVGTTYMGLKPDMFSNDDPNFDVTFKVTDGYSKITERTINDTDFTVASISSFIYNDEAYEPKPTVTDTNLATDPKTAVLVEDTDFTYSYENNINASTDASKATVTITGKGNYKGSITREFVINKRVLTITGDSDLNAIYNRSEQKITTYTTNTDADNKTGLVDGHTHNASYSVSGTDVGTYTGSITPVAEVVIKKGTDDVTSNYSITTTPGTLKINKSTEAWTIGLANNSYVYDAAEHDLGKTPTVSDARGTTTYEYSFVEDGSYVADLTSLKQTNVGDYKIYVKATNTNYVNEAKTEATLSITKRPVTFTGETSSKVYMGSEIELTDVSNNYNAANKTGLITGHTSNVTYSAKGVEVSATPYTGTITAADAVVIKNGEEDVTSNYEITTEPGKLTITQSNVDWTISLGDDTYTYDGATHYIDKTPTSTALTGTTSYSYKFEDDTDYVSDLSSLTKVDAGTYIIKVKATNPNYSKPAEWEAKLIINRRAVEFNAEIARKEYTGDKLSITGVTITEGKELPNGHTHNVEYLAEGTEVSATPYKGSITAKDNVRIYNGSKVDVTANFDITVNEGGLEIYKTDDTWSISLESESIKYDGSSHALSKVPTSTAKTGTTTYEYSFDENGTYVRDLSSLTKVDAGTYTVYVKATNPNYEE
ncbi:MAG: hypothetical protein HUJ56_00950, partial [Erysipelotrichaceae bacterium]|nr:hypothetical protein [Erysipelotrichaceae bacterium]